MNLYIDQEIKDKINQYLLKNKILNEDICTNNEINIINTLIGKDIISDVIKTVDNKYGLVLKLAYTDKTDEYKIIPFVDDKIESKQYQLLITFDSIDEFKMFTIKYQLNVLCADANMEEIIYKKGEALSINGNKELYNTRTAANMVIEQVIHKKDNKEYVALDVYSTQIQNFLVKHLYGYNITIGENTLDILNKYKIGDFQFYNSFMRGDLYKYMVKVSTNTSFSGYTIDNIVKDLVIITDLMNKLPKLEKSILITRFGKGIGKGKNKGNKIEYDSLVSFSTGEGIATSLGNELYIYKRILDKDEKYIPMDLLCVEASESLASDKEELESEFVCPPFSSIITKSYTNKKNTCIYIDNVEEKDPITIITNNLDELEKNVQSFGFKIISLYKTINRKLKDCKIPIEYTERTI